MATRHFFIGIDISKATLDVTVLKDGLFVVHEKIDNTKEAIRQWFMKTGKANGLKRSNSIFCMEAMGMYGRVLLNFFHSKKLNAWVESPLRIKRSLGLQRGKNDKIDSLRIAQYCFTHSSKFREWNPPRKEIEQLNVLNKLRSKIVLCQAQLKQSVRDNYYSLSQKRTKEIQSFCNRSIDALKLDLKDIDKEMLGIIKKDEVLDRMFKIVTSVYSVGKIMAIEMIIVTNEFKNFNSPRKFACYCGVAPFENSSGTSLLGKSRVSPMANRKLKSALHMCSIAAIKNAGEFQDYFKRKVAQGKTKRCVLNAIRNKIIHRIFACVNENRFYKKNREKAS